MKKILIGIGILFALIIVWYYSTTTAEERAANEQEYVQEREQRKAEKANEKKSKNERKEGLLAYNYAEDFVKAKLKSPSTAEFPGLFEKSKHISSLGNGEYLITSWVDSQNGLGAMLRSKFKCVVKVTEDKVYLKSLEIL